jgi:hypothetical protein
VQGLGVVSSCRDGKRSAAIVSSNSRDPRRAAGDVLLVQQLLELVGRWCGGTRAGRAATARSAASAGARAALEAASSRRLISRREEQRVRRDRVHPLLHGLVELGDLGVRWSPA